MFHEIYFGVPLSTIMPLTKKDKSIAPFRKIKNIQKLGSKHVAMDNKLFLLTYQVLGMLLHLNIQLTP